MLFAMAHAGFLRNFEETVRVLCAHGVEVHVRCSKKHETIALGDYELEAGKPPRLHLSVAEGRSSAQSIWAERVRIVRDLVFYSRPEYREATELRSRFLELQKEEALSRRTQALLQHLLPTGLPRVKRALEQMLCWADSRIAPSPEATSLLDALRPDAVIVTPLVNFGSREVDIVKVARQRGIPTILAVASWDNLTNKGVIKIRPDYAAVWNRAMANEAARLHGMPRNRIWITGATVFDPWFSRKPSRDRDSFCRALGLKPECKVVVYLCSSRAIAGTSEHLLVKEWTQAIRATGDAQLSEANLLVRPHPMELRGWRKVLPRPTPEVGERRSAVIWPTEPKHPTTEEGRGAFFDTLYHADAVVGLNNSAMIEAAILRKPILTFFGHDASETQTANLHFRHLSEGGFVSQARDLTEHVRQLAALLRNPGDAGPACDRFVRDFVRPQGVDYPSSAAFVERVMEVLVRSGVSQQSAPAAVDEPVPPGRCGFS